MRVRLVKLGEAEFRPCVEHGVWGSNANRFSKWKRGDVLVFLIGHEVAGVAEVVGEPYVSPDLLWDKDLYPYRIPIRFRRVLPQNRPALVPDIKKAVQGSGHNYGWVVLTQTLLSADAAAEVLQMIESRIGEYG